MLQQIIDWLTYSVIGLDPASRTAQAVNFFIYDSLKILLLLFFMIAVIGFIRSYISQNKIKSWIMRKKALGNVFASLFGAITPFCSCSSIPIFLSFLEVGIPLGVTFSFLITSPLINEYLVIVMLGFFGWKITTLYVISGLFIGIVSGIMLGKMGLEKYLAKDMIKQDVETPKEKIYSSIKERILFGLNEARSITGKVWVFVLIGVGIGAAIHN